MCSHFYFNYFGNNAAAREQNEQKIRDKDGSEGNYPTKNGHKSPQFSHLLSHSLEIYSLTFVSTVNVTFRYCQVCCHARGGIEILNTFSHPPLIDSRKRAVYSEFSQVVETEIKCVKEWIHLTYRMTEYNF